MFTYSPLLVMIIATITCVFLLWSRVWCGKVDINRSKITPITLGRGFFHIFFAALSLFLLDAVYRLIFADLLKYGHYKYLLATVLICILYSLYLMMGTVFLAPTWKTLVTFFIMSIVSISLLIVSLSDASIDLTQIVIILLLTGVGVEILLGVFDIVHLKKAPEGEEGKRNARISAPLWDLSQKLQPIFSTKGILVIFGCCAVELIFLFEGTTLFYWIP